MVVAIVQAIARHRLYIGFSATHNSHHARLKNGIICSSRGREKNPWFDDRYPMFASVGERSRSVCLGGGVVKPVSSQDNSLQPKSVTVRADVGDFWRLTSGNRRHTSPRAA